MTRAVTTAPLSLSGAANALARIKLAKHIAVSGGIYFIVTALIMVAWPLTSEPRVLAQPIFWAMILPALQQTLLRATALFAVAYALTVIAPLANAIAWLLYIYSAIDMAPALSATFELWAEVGGLWFAAFLVSLVIALWLYVLLALGLTYATLHSFGSASATMRTGGRWDEILGMPSSTRHVAEAARARIWTVIALLCFAGALFVWFNLSGWLLVRGRQLQMMNCPAGQTFAHCLGSRPSDALVLLGGTGLASLVFAWSAKLLQAHSLTIVRRSATDLLVSDRRAPVVFLRPFAVDGVRYNSQHVGPMIALSDLGRIPRSLDHLLYDEATSLGPVVAVGDPRKPIDSIAIASTFVRDQPWQQVVSAWIRDARSVVLCFGTSAGVTWEIDEVSRQNALAKTLVLIAPGPTAEAAERSALAQFALNRSDWPEDEQLISITRYGNDWRPQSARLRSHEAYQLAIRQHLAALGGLSAR